MGYLANYDRADGNNPNGDGSLVQGGIDTSFGGFHQTFPLLDQTSASRARDPEMRLDFALGHNPARPNTLSFGAARADTKFNTNSLLAPNNGANGSTFIENGVVTSLQYLQLAQRVNDRFSFSGQLRRQSVTSSVATDGTLGVDTIVPDTPFAGNRVYYLPSLVANYQATHATALRLFANRRTTDVSPSIFAPVETLLTPEGDALPNGYSDTLTGDSHLYELDLEQRISSTSFLKLFAFHSSVRNLVYSFSGFAQPSDFGGTGIVSQDFLGVDREYRNGLGTRYEHQISGNWFGDISGEFNRTISQSPGAPFDLAIAPYSPRFTGGAGLNYVNPNGNKLALLANHQGSFYQDTTQSSGTRPSFPEKTYFNLLLAREPTVSNEYFVQFNNLFNAREIAFNGIPIDGYRVQVGIAHRF